MARYPCAASANWPARCCSSASAKASSTLCSGIAPARLSLATAHARQVSREGAPSSTHAFDLNETLQLLVREAIGSPTRIVDPHGYSLAQRVHLRHRLAP